VIESPSVSGTTQQEEAAGPGVSPGPAASSWSDRALYDAGWNVGQEGGAKNSRAMPSGSRNESPDP
jgi:hypothetical protein